MRKVAVRIRTGRLEDVPAVLALYDQAVAWLVASGRDGQWGSEPWSGRPKATARVRESAESGEMRVAESGGVIVAAMRLGPAPASIPAVDEPELFLGGLVIDRRCAGQGIGEAMLDHARAEAVGRGIGLLRLQCWAGGDQGLVRYYERAGFIQTARIGDPNGWVGAVFAQRLQLDGDRVGCG